MQRGHAIMLYNSHFLYQQYYCGRPKHVIQAEHEKDLQLDSLRDDVLSFCMYSSVCKTLNLSFLDLMDMTFTEYQKIKELIDKRDDDTRRQQHVLDKKQDSLLNEVKNVRSSVKNTAASI